MGLGKAQPLCAKILTPFGWNAMGDMERGMHITGKDGKATVVTGVFPQGEKDVYEITLGDGGKVQCCVEHIWTVNTGPRRSRRSPWYNLTTQQLITEGVTYPGGRRKFFVPVVAPVHYTPQQKPLSVDPWLLGVILAGGGHVRSALTLTIKDAATRWRVEEILKRDYRDLELLPRNAARPNAWGVSRGKMGAGNSLVGQLRELGVLGCRQSEKFVPDVYMSASVGERFEFLRGLMDARGRWQMGGGLAFYHNSYRLRECVAILVMSLGGKAAAKEDRNHMSLQVPNLTDAFHNPRKAALSKHRRNPTRMIAKLDKVGRSECQCISILNADGLYVTNDYVVTHHSGTSATAE